MSITPISSSSTMSESGDNCPQVSFKVTRGKETSVIWHMEGWNCEDKDELNFLKSGANCLLEVGPGAEGLRKGPLAQLRFYFGDFRSPTVEHEYIAKYSRNVQLLNDYLSLCVEQVSIHGGTQMKYDLRVESVDEKLNPITDEESILIFEKTALSFKTGTNEEVLSQEFIKLQKSLSGYPADPPTMFKRPPDLRLKITVTPIFVSTADSGDGEGEVKLDEESSLCLGLKIMLAAEENYADLKLETKDKMTLSAHKVILAARSPVLRELLEKEVKNNDFKGTIKLPDVKAKPMGVILHWMYTGELQENAGNCMGEVVNAAIMFQLTGLIGILDKKVITICNPENMFDLFRVAKKNGMPKATEDIAKFIKENLD